jgi:hypothetical protein
MSSAIGNFICDARNFLSQGFRSLPVVLSTAILVLGLTQANFNLLFFFFGMMILVPTGALLLNMILRLLFTSISVPEHLWKVPVVGAAQCSIYSLPGSVDITSSASAVPSYWLSIMAFFFSYLIFNAITLYNLPSEEGASNEKVNTRKNQAMMSIIGITFVGIMTLMLRYATSCETGLGVIVSLGLGVGLAKGWYDFMKNCGLGRLDDLFGVRTRIMPISAYTDTPTVCVPTK